VEVGLVFFILFNCVYWLVVMVLVLVLRCVVVFMVLILMRLSLGSRLVSVVCLVVSLLEELATYSVLLFGINVQWGVWGGLEIMQGSI
jgi:hypothetical protein